jgi:transcriptional regulator with GAF, ATPase, and Fis domain
MSLDESELYRLAMPVLMETDPTRLLEGALDALIEVSGAARGCLVIPRGPESEDFAVEFTRGSWKDAQGALERAVSRSVLNRVLASGERIVLDNALEDPEYMHQASVVELKLMSVLALPVWSLPRGPVPVAAIYLDDRRRAGAFKPNITEAAETIAEVLGPRIEQAWRFERLRSSEAELRRKVAASSTLPVGDSTSFQRLLQAVKQVAMSDVPVLLLGESGTGKEVMARTVHELSPFSSGPWVAINCGALPQELLESELFGHERGAFTGATSDRAGKIASAAGGTLFLDEVGELTPSCQTRFLRVLQTGEIQRVGSDRTFTVKVRIVAATNRDLRELIRDGQFREDLYYRLSVIPLNLPTLRERGKDILLLAQKFLADYARGSGRIPPRLSSSAQRALLAYSWPGNVRELQNAMRRALVFCATEVVELEHLPPELGGAEILPGASRVESKLDFSGLELDSMSLDKDGLENAKEAALRQVERSFMTRALTQSQGNLSQVARETGINRAVLYDMLKRLELDPASFRGGSSTGD